jgi:hypothetical protein
LAAEDCDLVAQHGDLKLRLGRNALVGPEKAEGTAQEEVENGPDTARHCRRSDRRRSLQLAIGFLDLTGPSG